jgi:hypothetical protein
MEVVIYSLGTHCFLHIKPGLMCDSAAFTPLAGKIYVRYNSKVRLELS